MPKIYIPKFYLYLSDGLKEMFPFGIKLDSKKVLFSVGQVEKNIC